MGVLPRHYHQSAGLKSDGGISHVQSDVQSRALRLCLEFFGARAVCPEFKNVCAMLDHAAERSWRCLDAMQSQTTLTDRIPRCSCNRCGVRTMYSGSSPFAPYRQVDSKGDHEASSRAWNCSSKS
jgi:hypothetical protein